MNKLFKPRCLRRVLLCLALLFPIVYLCGGLFFALAGAHGEQIFAEPVYSNEYIEVNNQSEVGDYRLIINSSIRDLLILTDDSTKQKRWEMNVQLLENDNSLTDYSYLSINYYSGGNFSFFGNGNNRGFAYYYFNDNTYNNSLALPWVFYSNYFNENFLSYFDGFYTLYKMVSVPTQVVPENNSAYTDFIFSQPFAENNFISNLGKDLVNGSNKGFAPMNLLFNYVNSNVFHFESSDSLAMFGFGYVYYAVNVLIVYEILILAVKLIMLPLKAVDVFDKEDI